MENISEFADNSLMQITVSAYADKGYDAKQIRNYLRCCEIDCCIPYKKNSKNIAQTGVKDIMARQDLSLRDSSHGSGVAFTERQ